MSGNGAAKRHEGFSEEQQTALNKKNEEIERLQTTIEELWKPLANQGSSSWSSLVTSSTLSVFQEDTHWEPITVAPRVKKPDITAVAGTAPEKISWKSLQEKLGLEDNDDAQETINGGSQQPSPTVSKLEYNEMKTYGSNPSVEEILTVKCTGCHKPILSSGFANHLENCGKLKPELPSLTDGSSQLSARDSDASQVELDAEAPPVGKKEKSNSKKRKISSTSVASDASEPAVPAKRPPTQTADKPPPEKKQKVKKEKPKPTPKVKAPIDLDKQCGVVSGPNNVPCTRSLTCKSHSMGAKRAVIGRSQRYDVLLAAYQKKSIGRPQNNAIPGSDKKPADGTADSSPHPHGGNAVAGVGSTGTGDKEDAALDSDEEANAVLDAIRRTRPQPLATRPMLFVRRRYHCFRIRNMLLDAITPRGGTVKQQEKEMDNMHGVGAGIGAGPSIGGVGTVNIGRAPNGAILGVGPGGIGSNMEHGLLENGTNRLNSV